MNQNEDRKVTRITEEITENRINSKKILLEQLQREFNYVQAEKLLKKMHNQGLITDVEFDKVTALNRQVFSPFLARIMK
jgi:hypothetical protein